jgi:hypothetical protein
MIHNPFDAGVMFELKVRKLKFLFSERKQNHEQKKSIDYHVHTHSDSNRTTVQRIGGTETES